MQVTGIRCISLPVTCMPVCGCHHNCCCKRGRRETQPHDHCPPLHTSIRPIPARFRSNSGPGAPPDLFKVWMFNITNVDEVRQGGLPKLVGASAGAAAALRCAVITCWLYSCTAVVFCPVLYCETCSGKRSFWHVGTWTKRALQVASLARHSFVQCRLGSWWQNHVLPAVSGGQA